MVRLRAFFFYFGRIWGNNPCLTVCGDLWWSWCREKKVNFRWKPFNVLEAAFSEHNRLGHQSMGHFHNERWLGKLSSNHMLDRWNNNLAWTSGLHRTGFVTCTGSAMTCDGGNVPDDRVNHSWLSSDAGAFLHGRWWSELVSGGYTPIIVIHCFSSRFVWWGNKL